MSAPFRVAVALLWLFSVVSSRPIHYGVSTAMPAIGRLADLEDGDQLHNGRGARTAENGKYDSLTIERSEDEVMIVGLQCDSSDEETVLRKTIEIVRRYIKESITRMMTMCTYSAADTTTACDEGNIPSVVVDTTTPCADIRPPGVEEDAGTPSEDVGTQWRVDTTTPYTDAYTSYNSYSDDTTAQHVDDAITPCSSTATPCVQTTAVPSRETRTTNINNDGYRPPIVFRRGNQLA